MSEAQNVTAKVTPTKKAYVPAIGPRLRWVLILILATFAILSANSLYLGTITFLEWKTGATYQSYFYLWMFMGHLALGMAFVVPVVVFGVIHIKNAHNRPNRRAVRAGLALFATSLILLGTGIALTRLPGFELKDPTTRSVAYWIHVISPFVVIWLFVLHRLAGKKIKWKIGGIWLAIAGIFALGAAVIHGSDPRPWNKEGPREGEKYFFPSLARTATGNFIPAKTMMMDSYCAECHADVHASWSNSVHRFSSFNNPAYLFSVRETRKVALERDGDVRASRFCAGCHDPVPFFSGAFDDPNFDDVSHPTSQSGITCTSCHAITHVNSQRGNSDFTIEEPLHYPFAQSENEFLGWINRQLVKAKPALHKKTFLKPLHRTTEFCAGCHKVHLPEELNHYKWLRGQNHYDSFLLSGVSGHGAASFYYPPNAEKNCNGCHMKLAPSEDFGARDFDGSGLIQMHSHAFPSANTAIPYLLGMPPEVIEGHRKFNEGVMRVDIFGVKDGGEISGELTAPLRPAAKTLVAGQRYLTEVVIRTVKMGHHFTQGTADSNEVWLEVSLFDERPDGSRKLIGKSGGQDEAGEVDPWSHFVNAYVLDREGNRIDRRNAQDIFVPLYNHQIPPGAGQIVHYAFTVPEDAGDALTMEVRLRYRKFDTIYVRKFQGEKFDGNDLPILELAQDSVTFAVEGRGMGVVLPERDIPLWQRWNDYGIGLLLEGGDAPGELAGAAQAFAEVEKLARPDGPLNLARVHLREGRLAEATAALERAARHDPPAPPWTVAWLSAQVDEQLGNLADAAVGYRQVLEMDTEDMRKRGFDFSKDYRVWNQLGRALYERARSTRGDDDLKEREDLLAEARDAFEHALAIDPENATAHHNLSQIFAQIGDEERAQHHRLQHEKYRPDENAQDRAILAARRASAAANHAAETVVIRDLMRDGAYELNGAAGQEK